MKSTEALALSIVFRYIIIALYIIALASLLAGVYAVAITNILLIMVLVPLKILLEFMFIGKEAKR